MRKGVSDPSGSMVIRALGETGYLYVVILGFASRKEVEGEDGL